MSESDNNPHSGADGLAISGMSNSGSLQASSEKLVEETVMIDGIPTKVMKKQKISGHNPQLVAAAKRQSYLKENPSQQSRFMDSTSYLAMISAMGDNKLYKPYTNVKINDLREGNQPDGYYSATLFWAMIAGAKALPHASVIQMDLLRQNSNDAPTPKAPRLELDEAA